MNISSWISDEELQRWVTIFFGSLIRGPDTQVYVQVQPYALILKSVQKSVLSSCCLSFDDRDQCSCTTYTPISKHAEVQTQSHLLEASLTCKSAARNHSLAELIDHESQNNHNINIKHQFGNEIKIDLTVELPQITSIIITLLLSCTTRSCPPLCADGSAEMSSVCVIC